MRIAPVARVLTQSLAPPTPWERNLRYGSAYACTLIAVAAAQLIIPNAFAFLLAGVTILGLPISIGLRSAVNRPDKPLRRAVVNRVIIILTVISTVAFLRVTIPHLFNGSFTRLLMTMDTAKSISLLMQVFLIFAVCRCLGIVHDKDAVLSTVPSFSVLLLLIVIHKGIEVVGYFILWTTITALLFALDHRSELREHVDGYIPAPLPGQDAALSARSFVGLITISLVFASMLSYVLVSRQPQERGKVESIVIEWATRLTRLANFTPDVSINSGPEREIDFSTGPALPTMLPLWQVQTSGLDDRSYRPNYWRMFTLARYDGRTWAQTTGTGRSVVKGPLSWQCWPIFRASRSSPRIKMASEALLAREANIQRAFDIGARLQGGERAMADFGAPRTPVITLIRPLEMNSGFLPVLPSVRAMRLPRGVDSLRLHDDASIDVGVVEVGRTAATVFSELPGIVEYGATKGGVPTDIAVKPNPTAYLSPSEKLRYLQLPPTITSRLRHFAQVAVKNESKRDNAYRRAQRLSMAIQEVAQYTLRPPDTPENRDAVDYFLFDSGRGYCTYFASALTVLCRIQHIPARIVSGFTNTEWHQDHDTTYGIIREANAHAWTEVWVDGWGWATVDATPAGDRGENAPSLLDSMQQFLAPAFAGVKTWIQVHFWLTVTAITALLSFLIVFYSRGGFAALREWIYSSLILRRGRRAGGNEDTARLAVVEIYTLAANQLTRHYRRRSAAETAVEWFTAAEAALPRQGSPALRTLASLYSRALYSAKPMGAEDIEQAREAFKAVIWREPARK